MLPEAAGLTHWLLLLQPQWLYHLLVMQQLELDLQKTMFCMPFMHHLQGIYACIQELGLWCLSVECIYFSLWWSSECQACSRMSRVLCLRSYEFNHLTPALATDYSQFLQLQLIVVISSDICRKITCTII